MKKAIRITLLLLLAIMLMLTAACGAASPSEDGGSAAPGETVTDSPNPSTGEQPSDSPESEEPSASPAISADREGNPITLPESIERVISIGPSTTEILVELGLGGKIIAADEYSIDVSGINAGIPLFSMAAPDGEQIISLNPDIVFVTSMTRAAGGDLFKPVSDAGICVIYIPSSESIAEIMEDIRFVAAVMGEDAKGDAIVAAMESEIEGIRQIGETITERKTVYVELSAAPYMYSFGKGVYLNELIEIIGAENILLEQDSWLSLTDEMVLGQNPDVILSTVNYIDDPIGEIMSRPGWDAITAVQNADVYSIDANASNRPNHGIINALREMAAAIYPEIYG